MPVMPMASLVGSARTGGFGVDLATGERMATSISDMIDRLDQRMRDMERLRRRPQLGDLPEAVAVADLDTLVASGDQQSLEFALQAFRRALVHAEEAVRLGMANYAETEAGNTASANVEFE